MWNANCIVRGNTIYADKVVGDVGWANKGGTRDAQIYNNIVRVTTSGSYGIVAGGCSGDAFFFDTTAQIEAYNTVIYNNVIINDFGSSGPDTPAIWFRGSSNAKAFNNVIINMDPVQMFRSCSSVGFTNLNPTFINNIAMGANTYGVGSGYQGNLTYFTGTKTIDYNLFYQFTGGVPTQAHPVTGNPLFVNPISDWHLQAGSPAIGAGSVVTATGYGGSSISVSTDKAGLTRTSPWNLGIYSSSGDTTPPARPTGLRVQ
jgi:hypothetical protein